MWPFTARVRRVSVIDIDRDYHRTVEMEDRGTTLDDLTASVQRTEHPSAPPTASTSARPDSKSQRYDRQLRLWGSSGQSGLESASILVVNGTATATQILKNLVLPGIGSFTILDPCTTTPADIGHNFFLEESSLGQSRAAEAVKLLLELNDSVKGTSIMEDIPSFLTRSPSALAAYTLVISVDVPPQHTQALADRCWAEGVPLLIARSSGFVVSFSVQVAEVNHVETHPANTVDLRAKEPFPALLDYVKSLDFNTPDTLEHGHLPAIAILIRTIEDWKASHDGALPKSYAERKQLSAAITAQKRNVDEENFDEAVTLVSQLARPSGIPASLTTLFADPACESATTADAPPFWLLLRAVRIFVEAQSTPTPVLPLTGSLPDMKATSAGFHALQTVYRTKAREDLAAIRAELVKLGLPPDHVAWSMVDTFVKHAAYLHVARGRPYVSTSFEGKTVKAALEDESKAELAGIFVALKASEGFAIEQGRWPGTAEGDEEGTADLEELERCVGKVGKAAGLALDDEAMTHVRNGLLEIARGGAADLPQMAALLGGMVAQEAIKLVTRQYVPLSGTCVFDGVKSRSATFA